jgi:hypothetical protein
MTRNDADAWLDKLAIEDVTVRYSDAVTRGDWDAFEATWMPDAVWEESPPVSERIVGARAIREHVAALIDKADFMVQTTHGTVVDFEADDRAVTSTTIHAIARVRDVSFVNFGIYYGNLVKVDGMWRFSRRRLQSVYSDYTSLGGTVSITRAQLLETAGHRSA